MFLSIRGPWTQGEGFNKCNNLPEYDYTYNQYVGINRKICTQEKIPYMDFRGLYKSLLPSSWNDYMGCMTGDGEHQNDQGTQVIAKLFAQTLLSWLEKVQY